MKNVRKIDGFEGSGHPKWCHWGGQGAQSGAIGDQRGPVERSWAAKVALPVGLVCESYGNHREPSENRAEITRKSDQGGRQNYVTCQTYD